jgi:hypothetical protein
MIVLAGYIFSIATSFDDYFNRQKHGLRKITRKGRTFIMVSIISIVLYIIQYKINEHKNFKKEEALRIEKVKSDSLFQKKLEKSNKLIINTFAEGLAKYALKYDSASQTIERLIKENKNTVIIDGGEPFLSLCKQNPIILPDTIGSYYGFNLNICNSVAPSKNIKAIVYVVSVTKNGQLNLSKTFNLFPTNAQMAEDAIITQQVLVPIEENVMLCYFRVKGSWTNSSESKDYLIDQIYHFNLETKNSGGITAKHEKLIRTFLRDKMNKY